jgi:hypothetical protein
MVVEWAQRGGDARLVGRRHGRCGRGTVVMPLVGRRKSVCSARGCAALGDGVLGGDVGAGLWDRRSQRCTGVRARSVGRRPG